MVILSATSVLAPRNLAPMLSCVVAQITSPSLFTSRTAAMASWRRSAECSLSLSPNLKKLLQRILFERCGGGRLHLCRNRQAQCEKCECPLHPVTRPFSLHHLD